MMPHPLLNSTTWSVCDMSVTSTGRGWLIWFWNYSLSVISLSTGLPNPWVYLTEWFWELCSVMLMEEFPNRTYCALNFSPVKARRSFLLSVHLVWTCVEGLSGLANSSVVSFPCLELSCRHFHTHYHRGQNYYKKNSLQRKCFEAINFV